MRLDRCDPLLLVPWLKLIEPLKVDVLLLHCYPFHRHAGYLAQVFPHVYFDVGLGTNYTGVQSLELIKESLELAPFSKVLFSTDAWGPPELHYLGGARLWREGMRKVLGTWVRDGDWAEEDAIRVVQMVGRDNAVRVYELGGEVNPELFESLRRRIDQEIPGAIALRHKLHSMPDLSGSEGPTLELVLNALPGDLQARFVAGTGAVLRIGGPGKAIAIRAELDALPALEESELDWASKRPGVMHACGHDVHLAAVVALARAVHSTAGAAPPWHWSSNPGKKRTRPGRRTSAQRGYSRRKTFGPRSRPMFSPCCPEGQWRAHPGP